MSQVWQWLQRWIIVALLIPCLADLSRSEEECNHIYLIQPPSEIPCKPYVKERKNNESSLSLRIECVVTLPKRDHDRDESFTILWREKLGDNEERMIPANMTDSEDGNHTILRSVLSIKKKGTFFRVRKYWCGLSNHTSPNNLTFAISNTATVNPPEYYSSFPQCHHDTIFHLAEAACAETGKLLGSPPPSPSPMAPHCSSTNETESSGPDALNAMILTTVAVGIGVPIILATMLLIAALTLLLARKKRYKGDVEEQKKEEVSTSTADENTSDRADTPTSPAASGVVKQSPKHAISPPTHRPPTLPGPEKRVAAQVNKPQIQPRHKKEQTGKENDVRQEPYRKLDLKTVENPHIYTTTTLSEGDHEEQNENTRSSLTVSLSNAYGYVAPDDICSTQDQGMYQGLQSSTQDYLALYVTPGTQGMANSSELQPIYAEPSPNA